MKNMFLIVAMICSCVLMSQNTPSLHITDNEVTIKDTKGNTWLINDLGISKNGVLVIGDEEMYDVDAAGDLQDEIEDLEDEILEGELTESDYADLMEELSELEGELAELEAFSMDSEAEIDSTTISVGEWKITITEKGDGSDDVDFSIGQAGEEVEPIEDEDHYVDNFDTEWFLLSLGYNTFLNPDMKLEVAPPYEALGDLNFWGSMDVNLDLFKSRVSFGNGFVNFNYGLAFEWHHYRFDRNFTILPDVDSLTLVEETLEYDKNKFNTTHLTVPLSLGFETKPWDTDESFRMGFGYNPGLRIKCKTKHKIDGNSDIEKDQFNVNDFRQEVNTTIGYGKFNVYASYDLTPLFKEGEGPELYPVAVGIIIRRGF
ncbi:MAG: outer membrane beta-barrel protein [Chitinophagales bacterium]